MLIFPIFFSNSFTNVSLETHTPKDLPPVMYKPNVNINPDGHIGTEITFDEKVNLNFCLFHFLTRSIHLAFCAFYRKVTGVPVFAAVLSSRRRRMTRGSLRMPRI